MDDRSDNIIDTRDAEYLRAHAGFQGLPARMQGWILHSPHAAEDFARFFEKGGFVEPKDRIGLPYYHATEPPRIVVDKDALDTLRGPAAKQSIEAELAMFTTLAHEIGHDKFNPGAMPFRGGSAEEYVQYRARLEAGAVFNAFPIFNDLKGHGEFQPRWSQLGYGQGGGLGTAAVHLEWSKGRLTDDQAVAQLAAPIPNFPYTRGEPLLDQNADGVLTQRDAYLRDYQALIRHTPNQGEADARGRGGDLPQSAPMVPSSKGHPDHGLYSQIAGHVREQDRQHGRQWDQSSERLTASLLALSKEAGLSQVDHVVFSTRTDRVAVGENVFVVQGRLDDPAHLRAHMKTEEATRTPESASFARAEALNERMATQATTLAQTQAPEDVVRGPSIGR